MARDAGTENVTEILSIVRDLKSRFEPVAKCCRISRPPSGNEREGLPEAVTNVVLEMWENSQTVVADGEKKPLQKAVTVG